MPGVSDAFKNVTAFWVLTAREYLDQAKIQNTLLQIYDTNPTCRMLIVATGEVHEFVAQLWTAMGGSAEVVRPNWKREGRTAFNRANEGLVNRYHPEIGLWFNKDDVAPPVVRNASKLGTRILRIR